MRSKILDINTYLPSNKISNSYIEEKVSIDNTPLPSGTLERLFGIQERRFADLQEQVSDLAVNAAKPLLEKYPDLLIDCLIFAAASADLIEPATSNIIQHKLGITCPVFDIKNACNSFVTAFQVADSFIRSGTYKNILIVNGEKLSHAIQYSPTGMDDLKKRIAGYSLGDAGAAAIVSSSEDESGFYYQKFKTVGKHWPLCTIQGGGSMFPFDSDKNYFEGHTLELTSVIQKESSGYLELCLAESGWEKEDIDVVFTHQVSMRTFESVAGFCDLPVTKFYKIFPLYGNTAAASIPLTMHHAMLDGTLVAGKKVLIIGLAAGISISVQLLVW